jgi:hypothetical protein
MDDFISDLLPKALEDRYDIYKEALSAVYDCEPGREKFVDELDLLSDKAFLR